MPKLLEEVRDLIRTRHYSYRTEEVSIPKIQSAMRPFPLDQS
jgi:hypothetical protein